MATSIYNDVHSLELWIKGRNRILLVCGDYIEQFGEVKDIIDAAESFIVRFSDFAPNPSYESVVMGVDLFRRERCDAIMAIGGGSAMDVAKCIKLYCTMRGDGENGEFLKSEFLPNDIPFLAMPTTAGTGSEATRYAVIYFNGEKQSVTHDSCIPSEVFFLPSLLDSLPDYQRKSTMLDAFCHSVESFWSVNSTDQSKEYSRKALGLIMDNADSYLKNADDGNHNILMAAHFAGKAINITQTTAGHAMCYKLTSKYGIAHGHAAALCVRKLWAVMQSHKYGQCVDPRGERYLKGVFEELTALMGGDGAEAFEQFFLRMRLDIPYASDEEKKELAASVNSDRLKNNPIFFTRDEIIALYREILH